LSVRASADRSDEVVRVIYASDDFSDAFIVDALAVGVGGGAVAPTDVIIINRRRRRRRRCFRRRRLVPSAAASFEQHRASRALIITKSS
jgi:hypothetical protein